MIVAKCTNTNQERSQWIQAQIAMRDSLQTTRAKQNHSKHRNTDQALLQRTSTLRRVHDTEKKERNGYHRIMD